MLRLGQLIAVPIGVGAIVAALAGVHAQSTSRTDGLRAAVSDGPDALSGKAKPRVVKRYGNPPGFGAGATGFDSSNSRKRKAKGATKAGPTAGGSSAVTLSTDAAQAAASSRASAPAQPLSLRSSASSAQTTPAQTSSAQTTPPAPASRARSGRTPPQPGSSSADITGSIANPYAPPALRRRPALEEDPFAPLGLRVGVFTFKPAIEVMAGYDNNATRTNIPRSSPVLTVSPELKVNSDWERHELTADLRGTYTAYKNVPELDRPNFEGKVNGRIDWTRQTHIDLEGRLLVGTDNPGSPDIRADLARLPIRTTVGSTAGVTHRFNRLEVALKGAVDRVDYQDSKLVDGTTVSNATRNYSQYAPTLRGSYELTPGVKPFVEASVDTRVHDYEFDAFGFRRDSTGATARAGTTFELSRKLTGEASVGYIARTYQDPTLEDLRGLIIDASLLWTATALTTMKFNAKSVADESTVPGVSGVLRRDAGVEVEHAFRRWLIGTGKFYVGTDEYVGSPRDDKRMSASAALTYKLTRTAQIKGEFRQEWLRSSVPGADYTASIIMVGLRLQR